MIRMMRYNLLFPLQSKLFDEKDLIFSINHIRSRRPSIIYFILHCYDINHTKENPSEILVDGNPVYTSPRQVIGTVFNKDGGDYVHEFTVPLTNLDSVIYTQLELVTIGIDSENPLYFSELMLQENDGTGYHGYHSPLEYSKSHIVDLPKNMYANLYDKDNNYLQVIRPNKESFATDKLLKAQYTILAPHFENEEEVDSHVAVFLEALNQTEQRIDVLR